MKAAWLYARVSTLAVAIMNRWWRVRFKTGAWLHGGRVVMGRDVRFLHRVVFRGRGTVVLADRVTLGYPLATTSRRPIMLQPREPGAVIKLGEGTYIVNGTELLARQGIEIGRDCRIGARCVILDSDFHSIDPSRRDDPGRSSPVEIGDRVWLGLEVLVLKGVKIASDSVVGARAVVSAHVPSRSLVAPPRSRRQAL
jgi:acetyltransferase-like isoleucine patch superfamily enzyme